MSHSFFDESNKNQEVDKNSNIHFLWLGHDIPIDYMDTVFSFYKMYHDATLHIWIEESEKINSIANKLPPEIRIHTLKELENTSKSYFPWELHKKLWTTINRELEKKNFAAAADMASLVALFLYGGMYTDNKIIPLQKLNINDFLHSKSLNKQNTSFIITGSELATDELISKDKHTRYVGNTHMISSSKENPIILNMLQDMLDTYDKLNLAQKQTKPKIFKTLQGETIPLFKKDKDEKNAMFFSSDHLPIFIALQRLVEDKKLTTDEINKILWSPADFEKTFEFRSKLLLSTEDNLFEPGKIKKQ